MTCTMHVAWDERLTDYHFGPDHPLAPVHVELTMQPAGFSFLGSLANRGVAEFLIVVSTRVSAARLVRWVSRQAVARFWCCGNTACR
jgi:hypothetical protein